MDLGAPASYAALKPGTDVFGSDGEHVGAVEHVLADESSDIFDGLVLDIRVGPGGLRFADAPQVAEIRQGGVVLTIPAAAVGELPEPSENPATMSSAGVEDSDGLIASKLRRAWDLISGRY